MEEQIINIQIKTKGEVCEMSAGKLITTRTVR